MSNPSTKRSQKAPANRRRLGLAAVITVTVVAVVKPDLLPTLIAALKSAVLL